MCRLLTKPESNLNSIKHSTHFQHGIALHYFTKDTVKWREYHKYIIDEIYTPLGIAPHRGYAKGGEFGNPRLTMTYKGLVKKLEKFDYRIPSTLNFITILPEYVKDNDVNEYLSDTAILATLNEADPEESCFSHAKFFIKDDIAPFDFQYFCSLANNLKQFTGAIYGYYIRQPNKCDPRLYPWGDDHFSTTQEEYDRNIKWESLSMELKKEIERYLRDIYKINFLSGFHLDLEISSGITLRKWIETGPVNKRGNLHKLSDDFYAWYIEDESLIPKIRNELAPSGIIICV